LRTAELPFPANRVAMGGGNAVDRDVADGFRHAAGAGGNPCAAIALAGVACDGLTAPL
jgi:hypothetical protein